tara:strand:+ start:2463 stop:2738 length:276 start_codon:yes stop_codon:yes gene_type:complete
MAPTRTLKILSSNLSLQVPDKIKKKILNCKAFRDISNKVDYLNKDYIGSIRNWAILEDIIVFNLESSVGTPKKASKTKIRKHKTKQQKNRV